ncbi:MAG: RloB domain-containing protein [Alteromonadaceae bacterium]|nr:RloB domain-containing protein [Alteromonadaceae bacterium]
MGSDNLFHKRKAKATDRLERRKAKRFPYERVLIVCEGEKTEPNYFSELINFYKLNSANVAIDGTCGSTPKSVFERAVHLAQKEEQKGDAFDRVYCVFDKDNHESYNETVIKILTGKSHKTFYAAVSIPCFEYWLLLHFQYTTKPYHTKENSSVGNQVLKELKTLLPTYTKGNNDIFASLYPQLEFAKVNARRALKYAKNNHTDNPSTYIHELVDYLQNLK